MNKRLWWKVEDSNPARTLDQLVTEPITVTSTVSVDLRRRGIARCEGSARCQSANSLTDQQLWPWSISYGSNLAGRIGVTEHITGPSASECCTRARGRQRVMSTWRGFCWAARLEQGHDRWIAWSLYGRSSVGSERPGLYGPLGGVERPRRVVRFARLIQRPVRALGGPKSPSRSRPGAAPARRPSGPGPGPRIP